MVAQSGNRELTPVERTEVALAAEIFGWLNDAREQSHAERALAQLFMELELPPSDVVEFADRPEVALTMLCEIIPGVRAALSRSLRYAPLYLELARHEGCADPDEQMRRAAWYMLHASEAKTVLLRHMDRGPFPQRMVQDFLDALIVRAHAAQVAMADASAAAAA